MSIETLIDTTKPCPARIYDYWLGGKHNFPIDRAVAQQAMRTLPMAMQALNLNRWFVEYAGRQLSKHGISHFLDLGAGLPTEGALHTAVPVTAKVAYVDADPDAVVYSCHILQDELDNPSNVMYLQGRIEEIDSVLGAVEQFFGSAPKVGICLIGVTWFVNDDALRQSLQRLYEWAAPGSILALSSGESDPNDAKQQSSLAAYEQRTGAKLYLRPAEELAQLLGPWQPIDDGLKPFETYAEEDLKIRIVQLDSRGKVGYAGFFQRPS